MFLKIVVRNKELFEHMLTCHYTDLFQLTIFDRLDINQCYIVRLILFGNGLTGHKRIPVATRYTLQGNIFYNIRACRYTFIVFLCHNKGYQTTDIEIVT